MAGSQEAGIWAHSVNALGQRHALIDHLEATARLAKGFADRFGGGQVAEWAGLWHDVGKFSCAWQDYLLKREAGRPASRVSHKLAGAVIAAKNSLVPAAFAVLGHHGGLPSLADLRAAVNRGDPATVEVTATARRAGVELEADASEALPAHARACELGFETFTRMVFSALVDADFLDTASHFGAPDVAPPADWAALAARFDDRVVRSVGLRTRSRIDDDRRRVRDACAEAAAERPGMFRLHVPTGGGKTIAGMTFAARHASLHRLERVIVAVPFMSITEQNAGVYRELLDDVDADGSPVVLEHHSGVQDTDDDWWRKLAAENWDAPVVVTTTVQLFESLFSARPSAARKLHRIAGSVVILDEVQALPVNLLAPILKVLRRLVEHYGVTVLLSSATQPEFWALEQLEDMPVVDIIERPKDLADRVRRVRWGWRVDPRPAWEDVADELASRPRVLAVVNTVGDAAELTKVVANRGTEVHHLSTRLCPAHRRFLLGQIRRSLARERECRVVSTQLIEAGVDLDFPAVWRAMAPADSLLQAAGRANREGRLPWGDVVVFDPADGHQPPGTYRTATAQTRRIFGPGRGDPDDLDLLSQYYRDLYRVLRADESGREILDAQERLDFPDVARLFKMITDDRVSVAVARSLDAAAFSWVDAEMLAAANDVIDDLLGNRTLVNRERFRALRPFTVDVPAGAMPNWPGLATELGPNLYLWQAPYDTLLGVTGPPPPEEFVL